MNCQRDLGLLAMALGQRLGVASFVDDNNPSGSIRPWLGGFLVTAATGFVLATVAFAIGCVIAFLKDGWASRASDGRKG